MLDYLNSKVRNNLLETLYKDMELYMKYLGDLTTDISKEINFYDVIFDKLKKMQPALKPYPPDPTLKHLLKFTTGDDSNPFKCIYSLEKLLLNSKGGYKEAQDVYKGLEYFADYIAKKESPDRLGAATSIAKGLSFGVKNMGD